MNNDNKKEIQLLKEQIEAWEKEIYEIENKINQAQSDIDALENEDE